MNLKKGIGLDTASSSATDERLVRYLNLKLALLGCPKVEISGETEFEEITSALLQHHQETDRLLANYLCSADHRIQNFIYDYLQEEVAPVKLPSRTLVLDYHGLARALSLPPNHDSFSSDIVSSYRVQQGVLHNPKSDRRTTQGIFHIAEGGLPIPDDKIAVPKNVFGKMLKLALSPPQELLRASIHFRTSCRKPNVLCRCCCARWFVPRFRISPLRKRWRSASLRRAIW